MSYTTRRDHPWRKKEEREYDKRIKEMCVPVPGNVTPDCLKPEKLPKKPPGKR